MTKTGGDYGPRDVVWAPLIFQRTLKCLRERGAFQEAKFEADGKERPLLVIKEPDAHGGQNTLAFTHVKPPTDVVADFFKDSRGAPWRFLKCQGFDVECYLNIAASHYDDQLGGVVRKEKRRLIQATMFDEIIKQHGLRYLGMRS